jgi:lipid-A-disaccharide synthase
MQNIKVYIIAGESSGDILGAKLMDALRSQSTDYMDFNGIGGDRMVGHGLHSLFPMADISVMGFAEIVPHIPRVLKRIKQTVNDILKVRPDIVITIDSPGFCCRVAERLQGKGIKIIHYVAPTVWAYKPKRAAKFARLFNHILLLLPFEAPYFDKVGLANTYVGHPIIEDYKIKGDVNKFMTKHKIKATEKVLCVMPGSRITEIKKLMPIFCSALTKIMFEDVAVRPVIITVPFLREAINKYSWKLPEKTLIIDSPIEKHDVFAASKAALAKSGTGTLELSLARVPLVVTYKISWISYMLVKSFIKVKYANLLNLVKDKEIIPEFMQNKCKPELLANATVQLLKDEIQAKLQVKEAQEALTMLGLGSDMSPSIKAARVVLDFVAQVRAAKKPYQY